MATYKEVNGTAVQNYAGTYPGAVDGELWYNSTATTFQFQYGATAAAWATGGNLNTARIYSRCWNSNSCFSFWWKSCNYSAVTELYNGTTGLK